MATEQAKDINKELPMLRQIQAIETAELKAWFDEAVLTLEGFSLVADSFKITNNDEFSDAKEIIASVKAHKKAVIEKLKPFKDRINDEKDRLMQVEKYFTEPETTIEIVLKDKMAAYIVKLEAERQRLESIEKERLAKEKQRSLDRINAKIEKIEGISQDIATQIRALEESITDDITVEEAEIIRARIDTLQNKLNGLQGQAEEHRAQADVASVPTAVNIDNRPKVSGMSTRKELVPMEITNPMVLIRAIADGRVPIGVIRWDMMQIKRLLNAGVSVPGVVYQEKTIIGVRS